MLFLDLSNKTFYFTKMNKLTLVFVLKVCAGCLSSSANNDHILFSSNEMTSSVRNDKPECGENTRYQIGENTYIGVCLKNDGNFVIDIRDFFTAPNNNGIRRKYPSIRGIGFDTCAWSNLKRKAHIIDFMIDSLKIAYNGKNHQCRVHYEDEDRDKFYSFVKSLVSKHENQTLVYNNL